MKKKSNIYYIYNLIFIYLNLLAIMFKMTKITVVSWPYFCFDCKREVKTFVSFKF